MTCDVHPTPSREEAGPALRTSALRTQAERLDEFSRCVETLRQGGSILLEVSGRVVLMFGAATATETQTAFAVRHTSGFLQVALPASTCDRLVIPECSRMYARVRRSTQCVGVDAAAGITTGISAKDRAHTARILSDPGTTVCDITRPGHLVVVKVRESGPCGEDIPSLALEFARAAGISPGVVFADLLSTKNSQGLADLNDAILFAQRYGTPLVRLPHQDYTPVTGRLGEDTYGGRRGW